MTNTIPNVQRKLLEELRDAANDGMNATTRQHQIDYFAGLIAQADALLSAPSPAGVDGPARNFKTREGYDVWDKLCAIPKFGFLIGPNGGVVKVADIGNWIDRDEAQSVVDEAQCEVNLLRHEASDAQAIIDGLRGEVDKLMTTFVRVADHLNIDCEKAKSAPGKPSDVFIAAIDQQTQRIGELEGLLRGVHGWIDESARVYRHNSTSVMLYRIDAALSAGKEGA